MSAPYAWRMQPTKHEEESDLVAADRKSVV